MRPSMLRAKHRPHWPLQAHLRAAGGSRQAEASIREGGLSLARARAASAFRTVCFRPEPARPARLRGLPAEPCEARYFLMFTCRAQRGKSRWPVVKKWGQCSLVVEDFPRGEGVLEQVRHGGHDGDALPRRVIPHEIDLAT